jgi:Tol biopolymer transport system component
MTLRSTNARLAARSASRTLAAPLALAWLSSAALAAFAAGQAAPPAAPAPTAEPSPTPTPVGKSADKLPAALAVGKIAYEHNGAIKVIDLAADATATFDLPERMEQPAWNPDGKRFAYASSFGVSILDIPGQMFLSVSAPGRPASGPSWNPDGTRLIYAVKGDQPGLEAYDTRDRGRKPVALALQASQPAWHPKEDRLAFVAAVDGVDQVFVVAAACLQDATCDKPATALAPVQLTKGGQANREPAWSPDGARLAFERDAGDGQGTGIFVMRADGRDLRRLSPVGSDDHAPAWGSNEALAFQRGSNQRSICVMETAGARTFTVVKDAGGSPTWWQPLKTP